MAESFFASLEAELIERNSFQSKAQARMAVFTWIEGWYNPRRRHSGLGYLSPMNFERSQQTRFDASRVIECAQGPCCINRFGTESPQTPDVVMPRPPFGACPAR
ncbi:hypothetical protein ABIE32_004254, partial [Comamonas sp. 4034]